MTVDGLPILVDLPIFPQQHLVVVDSYDLPAPQEDLVLNREVFLLDERRAVIWQIDVPLEEHRRFRPDHPRGWAFVGLIARQGEHFAQRFDGGLFQLDIPRAAPASRSGPSSEAGIGRRSNRLASDMAKARTRSWWTV